jgi:hypothetical protein
MYIKHLRCVRRQAAGEGAVRRDLSDMIQVRFSSGTYGTSCWPT